MSGLFKSSSCNLEWSCLLTCTCTFWEIALICLSKPSSKNDSLNLIWSKSPVQKSFWDSMSNPNISQPFPTVHTGSSWDPCSIFRTRSKSAMATLNWGWQNTQDTFGFRFKGWTRKLFWKDSPILNPLFTWSLTLNFLARSSSTCAEVLPSKNLIIGLL